MTLAFAGTYLLVNFAPSRSQSISAKTVQYYFIGWQFLIYVVRILYILLSQKLYYLDHCYMQMLENEWSLFFSALTTHYIVNIFYQDQSIWNTKSTIGHPQFPDCPILGGDLSLEQFPQHLIQQISEQHVLGQLKVKKRKTKTKKQTSLPRSKGST